MLQSLVPFWPVQALRDQGAYFYLEAIEEYLPSGRARVAGHGEMVLLGGYSYLGLNGHPDINAATCRAVERYGTGTHGARLLAGTLDLHNQLESAIAEFKQTESAATFSSGYFANLSAITCLVGSGDTIFCDKLDHASIVDGCRLSGARHVRFRHNDMDHLESCLRGADQAGRRLVIVDAVFSMDGDIIDLPAVSALCRRYGATLMVDEAHSVGVIGATGRGIEEHFGLPPDTIDVKMGTLSKAIPSSGGYIAGSRRLVEYLQHQARGFIYSGALSPTAAAAALAALQVIRREPERVARLHANTALFATQLQAAGFSPVHGETAIFPIICGEDWRAFAMAHGCQKRGLYVQAIPHPVVPKGMARLRAAVSASHTPEDLAWCVAVMQEAAQEASASLPMTA